MGRLNRLTVMEVELLSQRGVPSQATYLSNHALMQKVAYQLLLKNARRRPIGALWKSWRYGF
jgi:hypothetical protein